MISSRAIHRIFVERPELATHLGEQLFLRLKDPAISRRTEAFDQLTLEDCTDYVFNLTINRTYDGFLREKFVIEDNLAKIFPEVRFEQSDSALDHAGDIDYLGWILDKAIGIQIKPVTAQGNFGNYSTTERMKASFDEFTKELGGKVFVVFSVDDKIKNEDVIEQIGKEITRLSK